MLSRHHVDTSLNLTQAQFQGLPETRAIEDPEIDPVIEKDPPTKEVPYERYLPSPALIEAVNLAIALGRPLLLQGEPGCGKTRLAYAVAYVLGLPLEVSPIKSTSRAQDLLYTYDAVRRLYDAQLRPPAAPDNAQAAAALDIRKYIRLGPLGRAIARAQYGRRSVVLIDEIDKADLDFPNDLLWELDRLEFQVAEAAEMRYAVPKDQPALRPIVFVTHNEEKALPAAFLRRCIYHYLAFPAEAELREILKLHQIGDELLSERALDVLHDLRKLDLGKKPGLSELLDWVGYLEAVKTPSEELYRLPYIGALLKEQSDQQRARKAFADE
jgi:MoxR-like ATPase